MERFDYHAWAIGLSAHILQPFDEVLPVQGSLALPQSGGFGRVRVEHIRFQDIISVGSITSVVAGSQSRRDGTHDALASVVIENFDVLGMVTADRIVARIAAIHPEQGPPLITPLGSHFENLRIAGRAVTVTLATDTFARLNTAQKVRDAYRSNDHEFRKEFAELSLLGRDQDIHERLRPHFPLRSERAGDSVPEQNGEIHIGLVREVTGLALETPRNGHAI